MWILLDVNISILSMWNTTDRHLKNMWNVYSIDLSVVFFNCIVRFLSNRFKVFYVTCEGNGFHVTFSCLKNIVFNM